MRNITFAMVKPDAIEDGHLGKIIDEIIKNNFKIKALKLLKLSKSQAQDFYYIHKDKQFYTELVEFISSAPVCAIILEKDNAVEEWRSLIGSTDPKEANDGTIRKLFARSKSQNAVHGSDSFENAIIESNFFFSKIERI